MNENSRNSFVNLHGLRLLDLELNFDCTGEVTFTNEVMMGNMVMSESTIPSITLKLVKNIVGNSETCESRISMNQWKDLIDDNWVDHRLKQLLHDLLYSSVGLDMAWNGEHDYAKVYCFKPAGSDEIEFYSIYERKALLKFVYDNGQTRIWRRGNNGRLLVEVID